MAIWDSKFHGHAKIWFLNLNCLPGDSIHGQTLSPNVGLVTFTTFEFGSRELTIPKRSPAELPGILGLTLALYISHDSHW